MAERKPPKFNKPDKAVDVDLKLFLERSLKTQVSEDPYKLRVLWSKEPPVSNKEE